MRRALVALALCACGRREPTPPPAADAAAAPATPAAPDAAAAPAAACLPGTYRVHRALIDGAMLVCHAAGCLAIRPGAPLSVVPAPAPPPAFLRVTVAGDRRSLEVCVIERVCSTVYPPVTDTRLIDDAVLDPRRARVAVLVHDAGQSEAIVDVHDVRTGRRIARATQPPEDHHGVQYAVGWAGATLLWLAYPGAEPAATASRWRIDVDALSELGRRTTPLDLRDADEPDLATSEKAFALLLDSGATARAVFVDPGSGTKDVVDVPRCP